MRQQMSAAMGALKLLADSFEPEKLNEVGPLTVRPKVFKLTQVADWLSAIRGVPA
jgi:hypothetical protein